MIIFNLVGVNGSEEKTKTLSPNAQAIEFGHDCKKPYNIYVTMI